jgi:hypothetical protein
MIALHRNNSQRITTALLSNASRMAQDSERSTIEHESENDPHLTEQDYSKFGSLSIGYLF